MISFVVLAIILAGAQAASLGSDDISTYIENGDLAGAHAYPFAVLINFTSPYNCNGVLISSKYVLTSGVCLKRKYVEGGTTVELGANDFSVPEKTRVTARVKRVIYYPKLVDGGNNGVMQNNLALIELGNSVQFSESIQPAKLSRSDESYMGKTARTCGWGSTSAGSGSFNYVLLTFANKVISLDACKALTNEAECYSICISNDLGQRLGQYDDGAPLIIDGVVVGIASQPRNNVAASVFTRINEFLDWIEANSDGVHGSQNECIF